jgi:hypothetical protein
MMEKKLFDNHRLFAAYGWVNVLLVVFLLTLLLLIFNGVYLLSRFGFVVFVAIHLMLLFVIKVNYLCVLFDVENGRIEFYYNKRFGWRWLQKARTTLLPIKRFNGYKIGKNSFGLPVISFFKKENGEQFELGPFHVGQISEKEKEILKTAL